MPPRIPSVQRWSGAALSWGSLVVAGGTAVLATSPGLTPATAYAASSVTATLCFLLVGLWLAADGVAAGLGERRAAWASAAAVNSVAWLAPYWIGWVSGPALVRSLALLVAPLAAPALLHLALRFGGRPPPWARGLGTAAYALVGGLSLGRSLVWNPYLDVGCWNDCSDNSFLLVQSPSAAGRLGDVLLLATLVVSAAAAAACTVRMVTGTRVEWSRQWFVLLPIAGAAAAEGAYAILRMLDSPESTTNGAFHTLFLVRCACLAAVGAGLSWALLTRRRQRRRLERLAFEIGDARAAGGLREILAGIFHDPGLDIAFARPDGARYIDGDGHPVSVDDGKGRARTVLSRGGRPVAVIRHDRALRLPDDAAESIGPAAGVAIDNERLRASLLATLEDLRASRRRLVAARDAARQQLERNLHDGAQQRLLAAGMSLRLAARTAGDSGDTVTADALTNQVRQVQAGLAELRELAHGIFPAILDEAGLAAALDALAENETATITIAAAPHSPLPSSVAAAAYDLVRTAVEAGRGPFVVEARVADERLLVRVEGGSRADFVDVADRVGALGGELRVLPREVQAEVPCA